MLSVALSGKEYFSTEVNSIQAGAERRFPGSDEGFHKWAPDCPVL